jgi:hypothetical protein
MNATTEGLQGNCCDWSLTPSVSQDDIVVAEAMRFGFAQPSAPTQPDLD